MKYVFRSARMIAATSLTNQGWDLYRCLGAPDYSAHDIDSLHEFAGRTCYKSYHRPNPATATNHSYLANVLAQKHESVVAHGHVTFAVVCNRGIAHEIVRHRFLAFSEVSQRYVDPEAILDLALDVAEVEDEEQRALVHESFEPHITAYRRTMQTLLRDGTGGSAALKWARGFAREELPLGFPTVQIVSGNIRAWRDFIRQRAADGAHPDIQDIATQVYNQLMDVAPASMQGMDM